MRYHQALSDLIESIIGAIYISDHFDPVGAEALFDNVLKPFFDQHITLHTLSHHPTKILFELFQEEACQRFEIIRTKQGKEYECQGKIIITALLIVDALTVTPKLWSTMSFSRARQTRRLHLQHDLRPCLRSMRLKEIEIS